MFDFNVCEHVHNGILELHLRQHTYTTLTVSDIHFKVGNHVAPLSELLETYHQLQGNAESSSTEMTLQLIDSCRVGQFDHTITKDILQAKYTPKTPLCIVVTAHENFLFSKQYTIPLDTHHITYNYRECMTSYALQKDYLHHQDIYAVKRWCFNQWQYMIEQLSIPTSAATQAIEHDLNRGVNVFIIAEYSSSTIKWNYQLLHDICTLSNDRIIHEMIRTTSWFFGSKLYVHTFKKMGPFKGYTLETHTAIHAFSRSFYITLSE